MTHKPLLYLVTVLSALPAGGAYAHSHGHQFTEAEQKASEGVFPNADVRDRPLSNWDGIWQSVWPLLQHGDLDPVFRQKAQKDGSKTFEQIKAYYTTGYRTDVDKISIENNVIEFDSGRKVASCEYRYDGYKILTYASGKKGVRYLFSCHDPKSEAPRFVQFSDHMIGPRQSMHFHIFTGNTSQSALLKEMDSWPTYYPEQLYTHQVVEEMLHH